MIGTAEGAEKDTVSEAPYVENNVWFAGATPASDVGFGILGKTWTGFEAYREATGKDARGAFADPLLLDPARGDVHLQPGSPAIDAGADVPGRFQRYVTTDVDGNPRLSGGRLDVGAHETGGAR